MNICFIKGKVVKEVNFKFYYNSKKISIGRTKIELENKSIITIEGYNEAADWMYQKVKEGDVVLVQGKLNSEMKIEVCCLYNILGGE